jgi:hypothetical protein
MDGAEWFGVRCWFLFEAGAIIPERGQVYEERVTIWLAKSAAEARGRAVAEAEAYAGDTDASRIDYVETYRIFGKPGDGAEVWSVMRDSWLAPDDYLSRFVTEGVPPGSDE